MAKREVGEGKSDGLEIISIGSLYNGPSDKKYWSSSRGKDRYPYPMGYKAIRAYNGSTYKMEIHEGPKGPLFLITSVDGHSCSGETPNMTWEKFQKTSCHHSKIWHGKRFSCKIDGVEFFGFKNPFVQRLLRELLANVNGTAESSFSSFSDGASTMEGKNQYTYASYPNLLPCLAKLHTRKKRSRRPGIRNTKLASRIGLKRPRPQGPSFITEALNCDEKNQRNVMQGSLSVKLDRLPDTEDKIPCLSMTIVGKTRDAPAPKDCPGISEVNLCAPDSLDFLQDETANFASSNSVKEESLAANVVITEELMAESRSEGVAASILNVDSEKSDFDSAGQEIAKSMMSVLLPQAIPLLKNASSKEKTTATPSEILPCRVNSQEDNNERGCFVDVPSPAMLIEKDHTERKVKVQIQNADPDSIVPSLDRTNFVVLDSYGDDQSEDHETKQMASSSYNKGADLAYFDKTTLSPYIHEQLVTVDAQDSSVTNFEASRSKDIFSFNDVHVVLNEKLQKGRYKPESVLGHMCQNKFEELQDDCADLDNSVRVANHHMEKDLMKPPDFLEADVGPRKLGGFMPLSRKDTNIKTGPADIVSLMKVPSRVYTRKNVANRSHPTKKCNGSLFESSIMCRNSEIDYVAERSPATSTQLASEVDEVSTSCDKSHERDPFGAEVTLEGQSNSLYMKKTSMNCEAVLKNTEPHMLQNQILVDVSEGWDISESLIPSVSHVEKVEVHCDKELIVHDSLAVPVLSDELGTTHRDNNTSNAREDLPNLDLKLNRDVKLNDKLEGIVDLVGCYSHPMPISSVLLKTAGNEINICVSCGLLVDRDRTLFVYKVIVKESRGGCPSFLGHTLVTLPMSKDSFGREIAVEGCGLQFTPDGQYLILLDSIRVPYCREGKIDCFCSTCKLACFQQNAVKIVQVKHGHVSLVTKLRTADPVQCILVCDPNCLIAVGESGGLHLWVMNSTWSAQVKEFVLREDHCISPCIVELKRIPTCSHLVVGHNGFGEFIVWDILRRVLVSRFSTQSTSIKQFFPISVFGWQPIFSYSDVKEHVDKIMASTNLSFSEHSNHALLPTEGEDIAIWLLVSTVSGFDVENNNVSNDCQTNQVKCWRLALLVKNVVILGCELDPRAALVGASSGHGIIGTNDGLVYVWELSTGNKLGTLHYFEGSRISCIATDESRSGVLGVAGDDGQLLVFFHSQKVVTKEPSRPTHHKVSSPAWSTNVFFSPFWCVIYG